MPVIIKTENNKIFLSIAKGSPAFRSIVDVVKHYHSIYDPDTHYWELSPHRFDVIHESLSAIDRIVMSEETEKEIEYLRATPNSIRTTHDLITASEPKVMPFVGKPPYENFQLVDLNSCYNTNRFGLFNEQGTGKSYILISTIEQLRKKRNVNKVLFITSASGVYNIKREFEKFSDIPQDKITIGGVKNRRPFDDPNIDIILCNYRSFLLVSDEYQKEKNPNVKNYRSCPIPVVDWLSGDLGILVLDESHLVSNPKARQTKAVQLIAPFFEYRYLATGTPADIEWKWYSQLKILDPALVKGQSYYEWLEEYFNIGDRFSRYSIHNIKSSKAEELSNIVKQHSVRRFSDDVLSLPEQFVRKYYVEFTDTQRMIYRSIVTDRMDVIQNMFGGLVAREVVNSFPYLILAIDNPTLLLNHENIIESPTLSEMVSRFDFLRDHSKIEALMDIMENHPNEKIVIWTSHPSVARKLSGLLKNCLVINGESEIPKGMTLDQYKSYIVNRFQTDPTVRFLIAGIQVMNTSVTLVAANIQIVFDSTFNYTEYNQALARIHRIGQNKPVHTYVLLIDESLDIARSMNLQHKDFVNRKFLTKEYIDQHTARDLFNMRGE